MNCNYCQEILLTDYLDQQLSDQEKKNVDEHLASCPTCHEFAQVARQLVIDPFVKAEIASPPETVWQRIKEEIEGEEDEYEYQESWLERLKKQLWPRPTFALAVFAVVVMLIIVAVPVNQQQVARHVASPVIDVALVQEDKQVFSVDEEIDYLAYLFDDTEDVEDTDEYNDVYEEYFL